MEGEVSCSVNGEVSGEVDDLVLADLNSGDGPVSGEGGVAADRGWGCFGYCVRGERAGVEDKESCGAGVAYVLALGAGAVGVGSGVGVVGEDLWVVEGAVAGDVSHGNRG